MNDVRNRVVLLGVFGLTFLTPPSITTLLDGLGAAQTPPSISFSATPDDIATGQASTLVWDTTNATPVTIAHGLGSQPLSGSVAVQPSTTTTYTLTGTGLGGTQWS